ncbi:hypothetical protein H072_4658 [Dactylellina haptotyla CBS 200.50]|uniref:Uncharacterized protein n=1 Tax=Dactylellina haptotyla (strain CBS 200.50) TaxID=1284197 RepID=S8BPR3_DACHA|nr:hypothetical protein H072_4658 [Dactylellina haptotyla CBS 200.50]
MDSMTDSPASPSSSRRRSKSSSRISKNGKGTSKDGTSKKGSGVARSGSVKTKSIGSNSATKSSSTLKSIKDEHVELPEFPPDQDSSSASNQPLRLPLKPQPKPELSPEGLLPNVTEDPCYEDYDAAFTLWLMSYGLRGSFRERDMHPGCLAWIDIWRGTDREHKINFQHLGETKREAYDMVASKVQDFLKIADVYFEGG